MQQKSDNIKQVIRFGVVGVINTLVDYGVFYFLISLVNLHKGPAQVFATAVAMCGSFLLNRHWTFHCDGKGNIKEITKFIVTNIVSMLTVIVFTYLFYDMLHAERVVNAILSSRNISFVLQDDNAVMFCKLLASVFSIVVNFIGNKFWVFKDAKK